MHQILCVYFRHMSNDFLSSLYWPFSRWIWVSQYQNVSILDYVEAKDDGSGTDDVLNSSQIITTNKLWPRCNDKTIFKMSIIGHLAVEDLAYGFCGLQWT